MGLYLLSPCLKPPAVDLAANLELSGEQKQLLLTSFSTATKWKPFFVMALRMFNLFCYECHMGTSGEGLGALFQALSHGVQSQHLQSMSESLEQG